MDRYDADVLTDGTDILGEGPLWSPSSNRLYWTDILGNRVRCLDPADGLVADFELNEFVACMAETDFGRIMAAGEDGWRSYDRDFGGSEACTPLPFDGGRIRFNDGKAGPDGAFWAGSMDWDGRKPVGRLFRLFRTDAGPIAEEMDGPFTIPNGLGWSPDSSVMYLTDSAEGTIYRYDFDVAEGWISDRRVFVRDEELPGVPDGLDVDSRGCVWSARWGVGMVAAYDPEGNRIAEIRVPARQPSSCCFGGPDLGDLYITSARYGLDSPGAFDGALFRCRCGTTGLPKDVYRS